VEKIEKHKTIKNQLNQASFFRNVLHNISKE